MKRNTIYRLYNFALLWSTVILSTVVFGQAIPDRVQRVVDGHNLPVNSFSFVVQEVGSNVTTIEHNPRAAMNPASAVKTITTLVALESLGPAFTWQT